VNITELQRRRAWKRCGAFLLELTALGAIFWMLAMWLLVAL
jgi:hypothetical protein